MVLQRVSRGASLLAVLALGLLHCTSAPSRSSDCPGATTIAPGRVPARHRPAAVACDPNFAPSPPQSDAGDAGSAQACKTAEDCPNPQLHSCLYGVCETGSCVTDSNCAAGAVCECKVGISPQSNQCFQGNCRVDSDCAADAGPGTLPYCSPSAYGSCGSTAGYFCHTSRDECLDDTDCSCPTVGYPPQCGFDPIVGHFVCFQRTCAG